VTGPTGPTGPVSSAYGIIAVSGQSNVASNTANDTVTFVAGSGMTITTSSVSESVTFTSGDSFKNVIPNGDLRVWQRGAGAFAGGSDYSADRVRSSNAGTTSSITRQSFALGNAIAGYEPTYYLRAVVTSVAGASNRGSFLFPIESVRTFANQTVTLSFWAKADASKNIAVEFGQSFGNGGTPSTTVDSIGSQLVALTTSWVRKSITVTIPSISGKTLGTNGDDYLGVIFWMDAGSTYATRTASLGQQSGTFDFWGFQLEQGSVATPFEILPYDVQLGRCQRYYYRMAPGVSSGVFGSGATPTTTTARVPVHFPVTMRDTPVSPLETTGTAGDYAVTNAAGSGTVATSVPSIVTAWTNSAYIGITTGATLTVGSATNFYANTAGAYLGFKAELV
jgi:hypothetical protein